MTHLRENRTFIIWLKTIVFIPYIKLMIIMFVYVRQTMIMFLYRLAVDGNDSVAIKKFIHKQEPLGQKNYVNPDNDFSHSI